MIDAITHNPYRILGVFSNTAKREIVQNTTKISRYTAVGKETRFACDLVSVLGPVERNESTLSIAKSSLESNADRIKHAFFWLISNPSSFDDSYGLDLICNGDPQRAVFVLQDSISYASLINRAVASFLVNDVATAIQSIDWLISVDQYREQFVHSICGELYSLSQSDAYDIFISALYDYFNPIVVYESIYQKEPLKHFLGVFCDRLVGVSSKKATAKLAQYTVDSSATSYETIASAERIYREVYLPSAATKVLLDENDEIILLLDKVVTKVLDLTIDAHNKAHKAKEEGKNEEYVVIGPKCYEIMNGIVKMDLSSPVRDRLIKNLDIISNNVNSIPNIKQTSPPKSAPEKVETKAKTTKEVVIKKSLKDRVKGIFKKK